jgi:hypothetical protein
MAAVLEDRIVNWKDATPEDRVVFMHSPKAAGSSVSALMQSFYGEMMFRVAPYVPKTWEPYLPKGFNNFKALSAHSSVRDEMYRMFDGPFLHLVIFREPVDRVMSAYNYMISHPSYPAHGELINRSIVDIFESGDAHRLGLMNRVLQDLSGFYNPTPLHMDVAKESIEKNFSLIGFFEDLDWFVESCSKKLGWGTDLPRLNATERGLPNKSILDLIGAYNKHDIELYNYAKELQDKRIAEGFYG